MENMTNLWQEFCDSTSLHGIIYLRKGTSGLKKYSAIKM